MRIARARSILIATAFALLPGAVSAQTAEVAGTTSFIAQGSYLPLDGVEVVVYRKAPAGRDRSNAGGRFSVRVAPGPPVFVLFTGPNDELPALQSLKADAGTTHSVHVTLYTVQAAQQQGVNIYRYIRAIIDQLESIGVDPNDEGLARLRRLLAKSG